MNWPTRSDYIDRGASVPAWVGGPSNPDLPESEGPRMKTFVVRGTFWAEITAWESLDDAKNEWPAHKIEREVAELMNGKRRQPTYWFDDVQCDLKWMTQDESDAVDA